MSTSPRLKRGFGTIRYLGSGRSNPYAVHPPQKNGVRPEALCYVSDWHVGVAVLTAYHAGRYRKGIEKKLQKPLDTGDLDEFCRQVSRYVADITKERSEITLQEVYDEYFADKFGEAGRRMYSAATKHSAEAAYGHLVPFQNRSLSSLSVSELQEFVNSKGLSKELGGEDLSDSTVSNIIGLLRQLFTFAMSRGEADSNTAAYVHMPKTKETVHHGAFTDKELAVLWANRDIETVRMILVMCYSGFRVNEYAASNFEVHLQEPVPYFKGGIKTQAGKERIVPIHSRILPLVQEMQQKGKGVVFFSGKSTQQFRRDMKTVLAELGLPAYTPHSTRHTFSRLCESYEVREADRKRMLGHSLKNDVTNGVYGHRSVEELKREIEKIKVEGCTACHRCGDG